MPYFHDKWVKNRGGRARRPMIKVLGLRIEELMKLAREYPEATTINLPPRSKDAWKSRSLPMVWVDESRKDILEAIDSCQVDENYLRVISFILRRDWYSQKIGMTPEVEKWFALEIRGNLARLLRAGSWVDEPENLGLKTLNGLLEKIDLGRRSDLKFSSYASPKVIQNYDQDFVEDESGDLVLKHDTDIPDFDTMYRDGSKEIREEILSSRPWMKSMLVEKYGEP